MIKVSLKGTGVNQAFSLHFRIQGEYKIIFRIQGEYKIIFRIQGE